MTNSKATLAALFLIALLAVAVAAAQPASVNIAGDRFLSGY